MSDGVAGADTTKDTAIAVANALITNVRPLRAPG